MPENSNIENRFFIGAGLLLVPLTFLCVRYVDIPVALFVKSHLYANRSWSRMTSNLPDLLLLVVLTTMLVSFLVYLTRSRKGIYDLTTACAKVILWASPASFLVKTVSKIAFGRENTRYWLEQPSLNGFHWFQMREHCNGFPSGHMLVIVTLLAALWRFYPKTRPLCLAAGGLLAVALVATNYHFVSDVVAGAYLGVLVEMAVFRLLCRRPSSLPPAAEISHLAR